MRHCQNSLSACLSKSRGHRFGWGPHRFACFPHPCGVSGPLLINLLALNSDGGSHEMWQSQYLVASFFFFSKHAHKSKQFHIFHSSTKKHPQTKSTRVSTDQNNIRFDGQQKNRCLKGYGPPPPLQVYFTKYSVSWCSPRWETTTGWQLWVGKFWTQRDSESCAIWKLFWRYSGFATILQHWKICIVTKWKGMETLLQAFCTFRLVQVRNQITKRIVKVTRQNIKRHTTGAR